MEPEPSRMEEGPFCELIPKLTLALVDSDSTVVYYNVFDGMQPPKDASESKTWSFMKSQDEKATYRRLTSRV